MTEKFDPHEKEKLICKIVDQFVLQPTYHNEYFQKDENGKELRWSIRLPVPGMGTAKRRFFESYYGKDLSDLWTNVLWGMGWTINIKTYEYYQKYCWDRAAKQWVDIEGAA